MRVCIHRGTNQIGGSCIELEAGGPRIVVDLGLPLDVEDATESLLPSISGLRETDPSLLGIILSHSHRDHWGLMSLASPDQPVWMGEGTHRILLAAEKFVPKAFVPTKVRYMQDRVRFDLGPFRVTPFLVDHSAYDAYALLIDADGRRLFYSGDIRAHGRKSALVERLLASPPKDLDVLLLEGSSIGRLAEDERFATEVDIERALTKEFLEAPGLVLVAASAQNIDRVVSIVRACIRSKRTLLIDLYAAEILRATGNERIPQSHWSNLALCIPEWQRRHIKRNHLFEELERNAANRVFPEQLQGLAASGVILFRESMFDDLERAGALDGALAIWSQWDGYLREGRGLQLKEKLAARGIPLKLIHTSGHASIPDLKRLAAALAPREIVPIHTFGSSQFPRLFANVALRNDGEWWEV